MAAGIAGPDLVALLADHGAEVDCSQRHIRLTGCGNLWLAVDGELDLFAVDTSEAGQWHFIGRINPGTILLSPSAGSKHTLVLRPLRDARLRTLRVSEFAERGSTQDRAAHTLTAQGQAVTQGIDMGLTTLMDFFRDELPPQDFVPLVPGGSVELSAGEHARAVEGVVWVDVVQGRLRSSGLARSGHHEAGDSITLGLHDWLSCDSSARCTVRSTQELLAGGQLRASLVQLESRIMYMIDRAIENREQLGERGIIAARDADQATADRALSALQAVLDPVEHVTRNGALTDEDPTLAACRIIADELGITLVASRGEPATSKNGPIEQIAVRSRLRTRTVALKNAWWRVNVGPLVGHRSTTHDPVAFLWRRGRYHATDPVTGSVHPITAQSAGQYEPRAVMFYQPLPDKPVRSWQLIITGLRGSATDLRNMVVSALVAVALGALIPIATGQILGTFVPNAQSELIVDLCVALLVASLASAAFAMVENMALLRIEGRFGFRLQAAVWDRLLRLPATFFKRYSTGELASAALGIDNIRAAVMEVATTVVYSSGVAVVNFAVLFWFSVPLALLASGFLLVGIGVFSVLGVRQMTWQTKSIEMGYHLTDKVFQTLRGLPKIRVAGAENRAFANWANSFSGQKQIQKRIGRYQNSATVFNAAYLPLCTLIYFVIVAGPGKGSLSTAGFLAFNAGFAIMLTAVIQITNSITTVINVIPMFNRLRPIIAEAPEASGRSLAPGELSGKIEVNHVTFGYNEGAAPTLDDISFDVGPGELVAIVGPSGCGKSTLLRLLLGFERPAAGTVLYDGQDLSSLDCTAVRRQCGVVLQQARPFNGTVLDAIRGAQNYTMDEAWAAAEMAGIAKDIRAMPMGMHTLLMDGSTLSGGQRQRLVIANALIRRPRILFFDEATSALDNETQRIVTESTKALRATRLVIAHRLSTVMDADQVLVLSQGRVAEHGQPADLLTRPDGIFRQLVRRQIPQSRQKVS
jgi:NHLM bacteriocin system ABC transporter ATP-binding protein